MKNIQKLFFSGVLALFFGGLFLSSVMSANAAEPVAPYLQFIFSPKTGAGDNTGDGGGGTNPYRYHEYYVTQTFNAQIQINTGGENTTGADAIVSFDPTYLNCNAVCGSVYENCDTKINVNSTPTNQILEIAVFNTSQNVYFKGTGIIATLNCQVIKQRENMYATDLPLPINFEFLPGDTRDSNITQAVTSADILNDVENALIYLWPDTGKPYVDNFTPTNGATGVLVTAAPTFWFKDNNGTTGDEMGIDTTTLTADYQPTGVGSPVTKSISWSNCTGTWNNRNQCRGTITPNRYANSRYYSYNTNYTVCTRNGKDIASSTAQTPIGPNTMDPASVCSTFTTEGDVDAPTIINNNPQGSGASVDDEITFQIRDVKAGATSVYGTGVNLADLNIRIEGVQNGGTPFTLNLKCSDPGVTCTPSSELEPGNYGLYTISFDPTQATTPFTYAQNSTVTVTVTGAKDYSTPSANTMTPFSWSFTIVDTSPPTIINIDPEPNSTSIDASGSCKLSFDVVDTGVGVDLSTLIIRIKDDFYQPGGSNSDRITITGDSQAYHVVIDSLFNICRTNDPFGVTINVSDNSGNALSPEELFALMRNVEGGICPECPTCPECPSCPEPPVCPECPNCPSCPEEPQCPSTPSCPPTTTVNSECSNTAICPVLECAAWPTEEVICQSSSWPALGSIGNNNSSSSGSINWDEIDLDAICETAVVSALQDSSRNDGYNACFEDGEQSSQARRCGFWCWLPWLLAAIFFLLFLWQTMRVTEFKEKLKELSKDKKTTKKENKNWQKPLKIILMIAVAVILLILLILTGKKLIDATRGMEKVSTEMSWNEYHYQLMGDEAWVDAREWLVTNANGEYLAKSNDQGQFNFRSRPGLQFTVSHDDWEMDFVGRAGMTAESLSLDKDIDGVVSTWTTNLEQQKWFGLLDDEMESRDDLVTWLNDWHQQLLASRKKVNQIDAYYDFELNTQTPQKTVILIWTFADSQTGKKILTSTNLVLEPNSQGEYKWNADLSVFPIVE